MMDERDRWIMLIKKIRIERGVSIYEAERFALSQPGWRRWVERQVTIDVRCRKMARYHIRQHGEAALVYEAEGTLKVR